MSIASFKQKLKDFWICIPAIITSCFATILITYLLPPPRPECFQPDTLCEPSPFPIFAGILSFIGILYLFRIISLKLDKQPNRREVE